MIDTLEDSACFLMQATLGANHATINSVATTGITSWLDTQLNSAHDAGDTFHNRVDKIWQNFRQQAITKSGDTGDGNKIGTGNATLPYNFYMRMGWWHRTLAKNNPKVSVVTNITTTKEKDALDLVRHRVAQALSEIIVISEKSVLELDALGMASFYDILYKNAFGSYATILKEVSLHPTMGVYLTHLNNKKASGNQHPDENYAREIMQLFTIGLNELNPNGTEKVGADSKAIPTYNNNDIKELAKVFTGIKADSYNYEWDKQITGFTNGDQIDLTNVINKTHITIPYINMVAPMKEEVSLHDTTQKVLLTGDKVNIPAGQSLILDVKKAVEDLVAHPNTAPFIAKKLIQQLVTSNPTPAYVLAVASKFTATGNLKEVVKEILTHSEARGTSSKKLKSPLLRITQLLRAYDTHNVSGKLWFRGDIVDVKLHHHVLASPTVFNFYLPNYAPHGDIENANQVAPEFQLHNSATSISYVNMMYDLLFGGSGKLLVTVPTEIHATEYFRTSDTTLANDELQFDFTAEKALVTINTGVGKENLIRRVSLTLTGTSTSPNESDIIATLDKVGYTNLDWVVQTVVFMIVISPEFCVVKKR